MRGTAISNRRLPQGTSPFAVITEETPEDISSDDGEETILEPERPDWYTMITDLDPKVFIIAGACFLGFLLIAILICCKARANRRAKRKEFEKLYEQDLLGEKSIDRKSVV